MRLSTAINREKKKLIAKANKSGIYENFGQAEVRKLEEKYINISDYSKEMNEKRFLINSFSAWCMNYST